MISEIREYGDGWASVRTADRNGPVEETRFHRDQPEDAIRRLQENLILLRRELAAKVEECCQSGHVIIESGYEPGIPEARCRCQECRQVARRMADAGYLDDVRDRWWEVQPYADGTPPTRSYQAEGLGKKRRKRRSPRGLKGRDSSRSTHGHPTPSRRHPIHPRRPRAPRTR